MPAFSKPAPTAGVSTAGWPAGESGIPSQGSPPVPS